MPEPSSCFSNSRTLNRANIGANRHLNSHPHDIVLLCRFPITINSHLLLQFRNSVKLNSRLSISSGSQYLHPHCRCKSLRAISTSPSLPTLEVPSHKEGQPPRLKLTAYRIRKACPPHLLSGHLLSTNHNDRTI